MERKTRGKKKERRDKPRAVSWREGERKKKDAALFAAKTKKREKKNWRASFNVIMKGYTVGADKGRVGRCQ